MRLLRATLHNIGPFEDTVVDFGRASVDDDEGPDGVADDAPLAARPVTVLFGADGTGKTSLLSALASTRPGHALPPVPSATPRPNGPPWVAAAWNLGEDDPERPHPLVVTSPSAVLPGETPDGAMARRREQALFDRRAQQDGGHVFVSFSGARWFSRTANMLTTPDRTLLRYDVRQPSTTFDDPTRADLTRETKQILSYAAIASALGGGRAEFAHLARFEAALREVLDVVLAPFDLSYAGTHPTTLDPQARSAHGGVVAFDAIPRAARHLMAFVALPLRALFAAYPGEETPREREGVVTIDDAEAQQDPALLRHLVPLLRAALPNVQWILSTASTALATACAADEVIALRKTESRVELGEGQLH